MSFRPDHEIYKRRFGRNLGVGLLLALFVALVFGLTVVKVTAIGERHGFDGLVRQEATPEVKAP
jgi:hypothetical protein